MRVFVLVGLAALAAPVDPGYRRAVEEWRREQDARLRADDGWLVVAGLFWLKPGANTAGSGRANDIALPPGSAPDRIGVFELKESRVVFRAAPGAEVTLRGARVIETPLAADVDLLTVRKLTLQLIDREGRLAIRLRDRDSKERLAFSGRRWFPVDERYRIQAKFVAYAAPKTVEVPNILGGTFTMESPGYVQFTVGGQHHRLEPVLEDQELFFIFRDASAGKDTYPAGRFLYTAKAAGGKVTLDFNRAVNPPCAFTPYATCPLPPRHNTLSVPIRAGELRPAGH